MSAMLIICWAHIDIYIWQHIYIYMGLYAPILHATLRIRPMVYVDLLVNKIFYKVMRELTTASREAKWEITSVYSEQL